MSESPVSEPAPPPSSSPAGGAVATVRGFAFAVLVPTVHLAVDPPFVPKRLRPVAWPAMAQSLLDRVDVASLITRYIDLNAIIATVDLNAILSNVDIDAIAAKIDLAALVEKLDLGALTAQVLDSIDIAEIIRESTGVVGSEAVRGVRMQGMRADDGVDRLIKRILHLRSTAAAATTGATSPAPSI